MKRTSATLLILFCFLSVSNAQSFREGLSLHLATNSSMTEPLFKRSLGLSLGITSDFQLFDAVDIRTGLLYSSYSNTVGPYSSGLGNPNPGETYKRIRINSVDIPILIRGYITTHRNSNLFYLGWTFGYFINGKSKSIEPLNTYTNKINKSDSDPILGLFTAGLEKTLELKNGHRLGVLFGFKYGIFHQIERNMMINFGVQYSLFN